MLPLLDGFLEGPRQAALARSRTTSPANAAAAVLAATTAAAACAVAGMREATLCFVLCLQLGFSHAASLSSPCLNLLIVLFSSACPCGSDA